MNDKGNVFDVSSTLMEIEDLPDSETDPTPDDELPLDGASREPDYFTPRPAKKPSDVRRRALAALAVVGGAIAAITLVAAATGSGDDSTPAEPVVAQPAGEVAAAPESADPAWGRRVEEIRARRAAHARAEAERRRRLAEARKQAEERRERQRRAAAAQKPSPALEPAPEPEPTYAPEPEPSYAPVEEAPPPPAPEPAPAPSSGGQPEFGF